MNEHRLMLQRLVEGNDLDGPELEAFMGEVMDGVLDPAAVAGVLVASQTRPRACLSEARRAQGRERTAPGRQRCRQRWRKV